MANVYTITVDGVVYDIVDQGARDLIAQLGQSLTFLGITTTALTDGSTTNPITVNGQSVTAVAGGVATYQSKEFVWNGSSWQEFGDLTGLGTLAYKNTASGTFTPSGTISGGSVQLTGSHTESVITGFNTQPVSAAYSNGTLNLTSVTNQTYGVIDYVGDISYTPPTFSGVAGTVTVS